MGIFGNMFDLSKKSQTKRCFDSVLSELNGVRIKAIFSLYPAFWHHHKTYRTYFNDAGYYILFENGFCLLVDYFFIDELDVQFRKLTLLETEEYNEVLTKDLFNVINNIHNPYTNEICRVEYCELDYGSIEKIVLRSVKEKYSKWTDDDCDYVEPTDETFDEIEFFMSNGKSFVICADDAEADGYSLLWSKDTKEKIVEKSN